MRRACVFIDGSNFYHRVLKKIGIQESCFDFVAFVQFLCTSSVESENTFRHYSGVISGIDFREMSEAAQDHHKVVRSLMSLKGWSVITTKLRTRTERLYIDERVENHVNLRLLGITEIKFQREREKAIDMHIGLDMVIGALDNLYDVVILVSSDSDLVPVCEIVRTRFCKHVEYVGFRLMSDGESDATVPTKALIYATSSQRILRIDDIKRFIKNDFKRQSASTQGT